MDDTDKDATLNNIMFDGIAVYSKKYGYLAKQESEFYWQNNKEKIINVKF